VTGFEAGDPAELAAGFVTSAAVLRHLQADPLLPDALLPSGWPGAALRTEYDRYDAAYRSVLRTWFAAAG
jgi:phenylacetic acid degradation operon negative regulatory protein